MAGNEAEHSKTAAEPDFAPGGLHETPLIGAEEPAQDEAEGAEAKSHPGSETQAAEPSTAVRWARKPRARITFPRPSRRNAVPGGADDEAALPVSLRLPPPPSLAVFWALAEPWPCAISTAPGAAGGLRRPYCRIDRAP